MIPAIHSLPFITTTAPDSQSSMNTIPREHILFSDPVAIDAYGRYVLLLTIVQTDREIPVTKIVTNGTTKYVSFPVEARPRTIINADGSSTEVRSSLPRYFRLAPDSLCNSGVMVFEERDDCFVFSQNVLIRLRGE